MLTLLRLAILTFTILGCNGRSAALEAVARMLLEVSMLEVS